MLDGRYACFGYTVDGARLLSDVKEGDVIVSAKVSGGGHHFPHTAFHPSHSSARPNAQVTSGLNNLVTPESS